MSEQKLDTNELPFTRMIRQDEFVLTQLQSLTRYIGTGPKEGIQSHRIPKGFKNILSWLRK